ncbi:unnamed protein product [Euphydryas editha]|uniref:Uncharacterized protein n=1 Tax=Euphydryas editha TaxID=104508 RepID=A0AAU9TJA8_EUPED|nr:unnamed protein product [Euphydryas editha]
MEITWHDDEYITQLQFASDIVLKAKSLEDLTTMLVTRGLYWMLARNSRLSVDNKLLLYKTAIKPIWTYGIQLWGSACDSSIEIIQRSQNYILKQVSNAPWFLRTSELHEHLNVNTVKQEIKNFNCTYKARLSGHPNDLAVQLTMPEAIRRLKRRHILDSMAS